MTFFNRITVAMAPKSVGNGLLQPDHRSGDLGAPWAVGCAFI